MKFKNRFLTTEFILTCLFIVVCLTHVIFIIPVTCSYMISRALFKKNRGKEFLYRAEKTTEFCLLLISLLDIIYCVFSYRIEKNMALILTSILFSVFNLARGLTKNDDRTRITNF